MMDFSSILTGAPRSRARSVAGKMALLSALAFSLLSGHSAIGETISHSKTKDVAAASRWMAPLRVSPFPLSHSSDKKHFVTAQGDPFLMVGEAVWSLAVQSTESDVDDYLDDRQARGINTILVSVIEHGFSTQSPKWRNRAGELPFTNNNDMTTINDAYFTHVDYIVQSALDRDMLVMLVPSYIGAGCGTEGWCAEMRASGATKVAQYGQYIGNRYKNFPNIMWVAGGDHHPSSSTDLALVNAVVSGVNTGDTVGHDWVASWGPEQNGHDFPGQTWLTLDDVYSYELNALSSPLLDVWNRSKTVRPYIFFEGGYEGEGTYTESQIRAQMYLPIVAGATGYLFGNSVIWQFFGWWADHIDSVGANDLERSAAFFRSIDWKSLKPDVNHTLLTSGHGTLGDDSYALASKSDDGTLSVTYYTDTRSTTFDMSQMAGAVTARWFDPTSGTYTTISGSPFANTGTRIFTPPSTNSAGDKDFVLLLQANASPTTAIAYVQQSEIEETLLSSSIATPSFTSTTTTGNLIVCAITYNSLTETVSSVSGVTTGAFTKAVGPVAGSSGLADWKLDIWYKQNITGASSEVIAANFSSSFNAYKRISCHEYSGIATSGALDQVASNSGTTSTGTVGPVITTQADELLFSAMGVWSGPALPGTGFTQRSSMGGDMIADRIVSSTGSYSATGSPTGGEFQMAMVTFKKKSTVPPAIAYQQKAEDNASNSGSGFSSSNFPAATTTGNLIACSVMYESSAQSIASMALSSGGALTKVTGPVTGSIPGWSLELWYRQNITGASGVSVTGSFTGAFTGSRHVSCHEYSGIASTAALTTSAHGHGASATASLGPISISAANQLVIMATSVNSGPAVPSTGFTRRSALTTNLVADQVFASSGSQTITATPTGGGWQMVLGVFQGQ